jgi:4-hydroxybenzoate polyprenyltransferase
MPTQKWMVVCQMCWIGIGAVSMLGVRKMLADLPPLQFGALDVLVFFGTIFGYHFAQPHRVLRAIAWIAGGIAGYCYFGVAYQIEYLLIVPVLVWAAYYGWKWPLRAGLRWNPAWKPFAVAFAWAWVTVLLPLPLAPSWPLLLLFVSRMAFFVALALPYDLHDRAYDQQRGLYTIAHRLGTAHTLRLIDFALLLACLFNLFQGFFTPLSLPQSIALTLSYLLTHCLLRYIFREKADLRWRKFLIDAPMPLQWALLYLAQGDLNRFFF